jgi:hypothetical protein
MQPGERDLVLGLDSAWDRIRRIIGTALRQAEQPLTARIASRIPAEAAARMLALIARAADPGDEEDAGRGEAGTLFGAAGVTGVDVFAAIRDEPGNVSVKTIGQEAFKLGAIRSVGLPDGYSPTWRRRCWRAGPSLAAFQTQCGLGALSRLNAIACTW